MFHLRAPVSLSLNQISASPTQSKHACQSVLSDIRAVWGSRVRCIQVVERKQHSLPGMDATLYIPEKSWGDMEKFGESLQRWRIVSS